MKNDGTKSIQDYRNIVKLLKLKIIKLQKQNEELQKKLKQPFPDGFVNPEDGRDNKDNLEESHSPRAFQSNSNYQVMRDLAKGAHKLGLTPEMLFRAADKECANTILVDQFRVFLTNLKVGLSHSQISRVVFMCDQECSGVVRQDDFYNLLAAYEVNEEKKVGGTRTFSQQSLIKLAGVVATSQLSAEAVFTRASGKKQYMDLTGLADWVQANGQDQMNQKEVVAAFNHLDMQRNGQIMQDFWVSQIRKAAQVNGKTIASSDGDQGTENTESQDTQKKPTKIIEEKQQLIELEPAGGAQDGDWEYTEISPEDQEKEIKEIIAKLEGKRLKLIDILRDLTKVENVRNLSSGILITDMLLLFEKYQKGRKIDVPQADVVQFYKALDLGQNGSINFTELIRFYGRFKPEKSFDFLFQLLSAKLKYKQIDPKVALALEGYTEDYDVTKPDMLELGEDLFEIEDRNQYIKEELWVYFSQGAASFQTQVIIDEISRYYYDAEKLNQTPRDVLNKSNNMIMNNESSLKLSKILKNKAGQKNYDFEFFEEFLKQHKPSFDPKDFASKEFYTPGQKVKEQPRWQTIVTTQQAAIKLGHELIREMKKQGLTRWRDPEFGATENDQFGSKSMYISDNDIAPGCPEPGECQWLSPEEILRIQLANEQPITPILFRDHIAAELAKKDGRTEDDILATLPTCQDLLGQLDAGDITPQLSIEFIKGGAGSNDVKQSQYLGNCWFVSALSLIASDDFLLQGFYGPGLQKQKQLSNQDLLNITYGVHPPLFRYLRNFGIFVFQFFKKNKWNYVFVDERLCCRENGEIIYANCLDPTETWVPYIEKALAQIHHNYQALISGDIAQGLADMTGMVADKTQLETAQLNEANDQGQQARDDLWKKLVNAKKNQTMMGCSAEGATQGFIEIEGENTGVMSGHAYSITDVFEIPWHPDTRKEKLEKVKDLPRTHETHRLLRIRNPWGFGEQKMKWCEESENETYDQKLGRYAFGPNNLFDQYYEREVAMNKQENEEGEKLGLSPYDLPEKYDPQRMDGTFLMCFKDWRTLFSNLFMCINFPQDFQGTTIIQEVNADNNAGVPKQDEQSQIDYAMKNPQFVMDVQVDTEIYICLKQPDGRMFYGEKFPYERVMSYLLLCVFKLDGEPYLKKFDMSKKLYDSGKLNLRRECDTDLNPYKPGKYAIIPCTQVAEEEQTFFISIYAQVPSGQNLSDVIQITDRAGKSVKLIDVTTESDIAPPGRQPSELMEFAENLIIPQN